MDSKDFKKIITDKLKNTYKKALSVYSYKQRQSRPRVKKNILQTETVIDRIEEDMNHCVVNDCTHDWGGKIDE